MESRLAEIEIKLSYTEQTLEELNRTVYRQSREIDELRKQLHALIEQGELGEPFEEVDVDLQRPDRPLVGLVRLDRIRRTPRGSGRPRGPAWSRRRGPRAPTRSASP